MYTQQLTFTRIIAAILIVAYHFGRNNFPFNTQPLFPFVSQAYNLVSYFFILSGFVMVIAYSKVEKINYYTFQVKRVARILPLLFLSAFMTILISTIAGHKGGITEYLLALFGIQSWVPGYSLIFNFPSWAIGVELFFYLLFPLLYNHIYSKTPTKVLVPIIVVIWLITQIVLHLWFPSSLNSGRNTNIYDFMLYGPVMHFNEFLIGNMIGMVYIKIYQKRTGNYSLLLIMLTALLFIAFRYHPMGWIYHNGLLAVVFAPLILFLSLDKGIISKVFLLKPLVYLGNLSYAFYILQVPVFKFSNFLLLRLNIGGVVDRVNIGLILLFLISILSYEKIEKPAREWILKWGNRGSIGC